MLIPMSKVRSATDAIVRLCKPARITLFGSYAYGKPNRHSDIDLLVLMNHAKGTRSALRILRHVQFGFPLDLIVRTPKQYYRRIGMGDWFLTEIDEKGKVLYEGAHSRMDRKSGRRLSRRNAPRPRKKAASA